MKKLFINAIIFLIVYQFLSAKNMLWEITSFDDEKVYLLGSVHAGTKEMFPLTEPVENAFLESDALALECRILEQVDSTKMESELKKAYWQKGSLKDHISVDLYNKFRNRFTELGTNPDNFTIFRPWYISITLQNLLLEKSEYSLDFGVDRYFEQKAMKQNKPIYEVEGSVEQLQFLSSLADSTQIMFLEYSLRDINDTNTETSDIIKAWQKGNTQQLEKHIFDAYTDFRELSPLFDRLILGRNVKMAEKIESYIHSEETIFVVVGAAHVVGEQGIIQILRRKGYFIRRM